MKRFGFTTISIEDIVFTYLPSKISEPVETTSDIQQLLTVRTTMGASEASESRKGKFVLGEGANQADLSFGRPRSFFRLRLHTTRGYYCVKSVA